jgi:hypothetical protein
VREYNTYYFIYLLVMRIVYGDHYNEWKEAHDQCMVRLGPEELHENRLRLKIISNRIFQYCYKTEQ